MSFLIPSFFAGILTVLAPCVLTLLPVMLGSSAGEKDRVRPLVITAALAVSVLLFSLLLKGTTVFIAIPNQFWASISGAIVFLFGLTMLFPNAWTNLSYHLGLQKSEKLLYAGGSERNLKSAIILGVALGPVFSTCSPTYAIILAIILPASFWLGVLNLLAYVFGLSLILLAIAYGGQSLTRYLRFAANPDGWFKKTLGLLLILTGLAIVTGFDKKLESAILDTGYLGPIELEQRINSYFGAGGR